MAADRDLRIWWAAYKCHSNPRDWVTIPFYHVFLPVPRVAVEAYEALEQALVATGLEISGSDTGNYVCRNIDWKPDSDPTAVPSMHSYGIAIDIDWFQNPDGPRGSDPFSGELQPVHINAVTAIKNVAGQRLWTWGGYWNRVDRMHFQLDVPPSGCVVDWSTVKEADNMAFNDHEERTLKEFVSHLDLIGSDGSFPKYVIPWYRKLRNLTPEQVKNIESRVAVLEGQAGGGGVSEDDILRIVADALLN